MKLSLLRITRLAAGIPGVREGFAPREMSRKLFDQIVRNFTFNVGPRGGTSVGLDLKLAYESDVQTDEFDPTQGQVLIYEAGMEGPDVPGIPGDVTVNTLYTVAYIGPLLVTEMVPYGWLADEILQKNPQWKKRVEQLLPKDAMDQFGMGFGNVVDAESGPGPGDTYGAGTAASIINRLNLQVVYVEVLPVLWGPPEAEEHIRGAWKNSVQQLHRDMVGWARKSGQDNLELIGTHFGFPDWTIWGQGGSPKWDDVRAVPTREVDERLFVMGYEFLGLLGWPPPPTPGEMS